MTLQKLFFFFTVALSSLNHAMQNNTFERCRILVDLFRFQEDRVLSQLVQAYHPTPIKFEIVSHEFTGQLLLVDVYDSPKNLLLKLRNKTWFNPKVLMHAPGIVNKVKGTI